MLQRVIFFRYACHLLRQDMRQIVITLDAPDIIAIEKQGDKEAVAKVNNSRLYICNFSSIVIIETPIALGFSREHKEAT